MRNESAFVVVIGGGPFEAARLVNESLARLSGPVHIVRIAGHHDEQPLTLAMLMERLFDREAGSLRCADLKPALSTLLPRAAASVRRILVIDGAEFVPPDVLEHLAFLVTSLSLKGATLEIVLLGAIDFFKYCPSVAAQHFEDVIDLDIFPQVSLMATKPTSEGASSQSNSGADTGFRGGFQLRHRLLVVLGGSLFFGVGIGSAYFLAKSEAMLPLQRLGRTASLSLPSFVNAPIGAPVLKASPAQEPQADPASAAIGAVAEPPLSPDALTSLMRRGDAMLAIGDVVAARLFFERGASTSAAAALAAGKTYDTYFLSHMGARRTLPDHEAAAHWYERAMEMGDPDAAGLLARLQSPRSNDRRGLIQP